MRLDWPLSLLLHVSKVSLIQADWLTLAEQKQPFLFSQRTQSCKIFRAVQDLCPSDKIKKVKIRKGEK